MNMKRDGDMCLICIPLPQKRLWTKHGAWLNEQQIILDFPNMNMITCKYSSTEAYISTQYFNV